METGTSKSKTFSTVRGEEMKEIFSALAKAQSKFEAALKGSNNPHFRSKYAALDACVDAVRSSLNEQGIFLTQTVESSEAGITVETVFAHASGEVYAGGKLYMPVSKHDAQGYGSALTYARRYSLLAACGVAPEDDDGNAAAAAKPADDEIYQSFEGRHLPVLREAALGGWEALKEALKKVPAGPLKDQLGKRHGESLKSAAREMDKVPQ